jgi:hypothetical protein
VRCGSHPDCKTDGPACRCVSPAPAKVRCPRGRGFTTRTAAVNFAAHNAKLHEPASCECGRWHLVKPTPEQIAERDGRRERERAARVAAYLGSVPERDRSE